MRNLRWGLALIVALTASALFVACDDDNNGADPTSTTASGDNGDDEPTQEPANNGGDQGELREAIDKFIASTYQAVYEADGLGGEDGPSTLTMFKDGEDRIRFDFTGTSEGEEFSGTFIVNGEESTFCSEGEGFQAILGVDSSEGGVCFRAPEDGTNPFGGVENIFDDLESDDMTLLGTSEREIAGSEATCYRTEDADGAISIACINDDGVLLEASEEGTENSTITATSFSDDVSDDDFDPPYEVQDFPTLGE
jgi:hypothetical protein